MATTDTAMLTGLTIPFVGLKKQYDALRSEILDVTDSVLRSGNLMDGNYTIEFEHWLAKRNHSRHAVSCHSGTQALEIIARYQKQQQDGSQRVIVPAVTFPATANAFMNLGYEVVLGDVDAHGLLDLKSISTQYDCVLLMGLYGHSVRSLSYECQGLIIEDAAQHWLADDCERFGLAAALSFDPMKNLPNYGNGGAVVTDDLSLCEFARRYRNNGKYSHEITGTNSRMSEIDCAQLLIKARHVDTWQKRRIVIATYWCEIFAKHNIRCFVDQSHIRTHGLQKFVLDLDNRDTVKDLLALRKIETRVHYSRPLFELPAYQHLPHPGFLSCASALSRRVLSLPFYAELSDLEVEYIAEQVVSVVRSCLG